MRRSEYTISFPARWLGCLLLAWGMLWGSPCSAQASQPDQQLTAAIEHYRSFGAEAAFPEFERLLENYTVAESSTEMNITLRFLGELQWRLGNFEESRNYLDQSLELARLSGNTTEEAKALNVLGLLEWDEGRFEQALAAFDKAHEIAYALGDLRMQASVTNNRALVLDELGRYAESRQDYETALALFEAIEDLRGQGDALGNLGGVHLLVGQFREAIALYQRALDISTRLESRTSMTIDNGNLGLAYAGMGRYPEALRYFESALSLAIETGMRVEEAYWRRGKAGALQARGRYDDALQEYRQALESAKEAGAPMLELDTLTDQGELYLELGDTASASSAFREASRLAHQIGSPQGITATLISLGNAQMAQGLTKQALSNYRMAAQRAAEAGEVGFEATALVKLSLAEQSMGELKASARSAIRAIDLASDAGAKPAEAEAWLSLAGTSRLTGELSEAVRAYDRAEETAGDDPDLSWQIHYGRALTLKDRGDRLEAIEELKLAIEVIESVRTELASTRFRSGWMQDKHVVYTELARLQLGMGRQEQAFMAAERLRAQIYLAMVSDSGYSSRTSQQKSEEAILRARITQLHDALDEERSLGENRRRQSAIDYFSSELHAAERQYLAFLDDLGEDPVRKSIRKLPTVGEIQRALGPSQVLLEYLVTEDELIIFFLKRKVLRTFVYESGHGDLRARTNLLVELVADTGNGDWVGPASRLSSILLDSVAEADLLADVEHLTIVPHGILNQIPFALLPSPGQKGQLLVENFTISYLPAAAALVRSPVKARAEMSILAMAPQSAQLRYAPEEVRSVAKLFSGEVTLLEGHEATESAFKSSAPSHQVIHLATHGIFNKINPMLSALELEADEVDDGMLEVHEILGLDLQADLVTLSACQTALGSGWFDSLPAGDEFVGLARAFMQAGSSSILASLWEVDDRSTGSLMEGFYRELEPAAGRFGKAAALARIQRELRASEQYSHPFYWAPFVLMGGYRADGSHS